MPHEPDWHILDSDFASADAGLRPPVRTVVHGSYRFTIANLDRADPPGYIPGGVPRLNEFNPNVFRITATPRMPAIRVSCAIEGFDPLRYPIHWRLVCRHVLCRHMNTGHFRYRGAAEGFEGEWRGESASPDFAIFGPDCRYTYSDDTRVLGGHGLLIAAVRLDEATLCDYVHVRVSGANPTQTEVFRYLDTHLANYDENVVRMVRAIFQHESTFTQFASLAQQSAAMTFARRHHADSTQGDCHVRFDWPDDPPGFPLASFDFGVGISQFTRLEGQRVSPELAWDWRENVRLGANLFLGKLRRKVQPDISWKHLALAAWAAYNGSGDAAQRYAQRLAMSDEGARISLNRAVLAPRLAMIEPMPALTPPAPWLDERPQSLNA